jgi:hypothetical protein
VVSGCLVTGWTITAFSLSPKMSRADKIPWKRLSVEALAIVGSILLAFAIDAWWEDLARSSDEVESLELI